MNCRIAHRVNERESDLRAIKEGWYAMDENGNLSFGRIPAARVARTKSVNPPSGRCRTEICASRDASREYGSVSLYIFLPAGSGFCAFRPYLCCVV
jgi:hypothetical protein